MRREAMLLGHPRLIFPLKTRLKVQSIGSGAKHILTTDSVRGWEIDAEFSADVRTGYNPMSLLEIWIEDESLPKPIYGFAKFIQSLGKNGMTIRIIEMDGDSRASLQALLDKTIDGPTETAV